MSQSHEILEMPAESICFMQYNITIGLSICYWHDEDRDHKCLAH